MCAEPIQQFPGSDADGPAEDFTPAQTEEVSPELQKLREENRKLTDQLLRKQAEVENFRKRAEREKEEFMQYSLSSAVKELLPILDGFELAMNNDGGGDEYRKGIALIYQKLASALQKLGLKPIESKGQEFDPHQHQAVATVETDEVPEHNVVEELQRGYFFKDRLLRPAMVKVAKRR
jgi:molecular chaperone GrpE